MVVEGLLHPASQLATTRRRHTTTLAEEVGVENADEDDLYEAIGLAARTSGVHRAAPRPAPPARRRAGVRRRERQRHEVRRGRYGSVPACAGEPGRGSSCRSTTPTPRRRPRITRRPSAAPRIFWRARISRCMRPTAVVSFLCFSAAWPTSMPYACAAFLAASKRALASPRASFSALESLPCLRLRSSSCLLYFRTAPAAVRRLLLSS